LPEGAWAADLRVGFPIEKGWLVGRPAREGFDREDEYVVTLGHPSLDAQTWFGAWRDRARVVAGEYGLEFGEQGLELLPNGWIDAQRADITLCDQLVEMRSPF
jgi:hypothetical protein